MSQARELAEQLRASVQRSEQLAKDGLRIAKELHRQGLETDLQLAKADYLAGRLTEKSEVIQLLAENVQQATSPP